MKVVALVNAAAGTRGGDDRLAEAREALANAGVEAELRPTEGAALAEAARAALAQGADVVIAGGGDGTVSAVAGVLAGTPALLGVLPMGTLNHFARDLRLPPRPEHAARFIADALREAEPSPAGRLVRAVDVGDVNGRCFVNNASIGLYPHIVSKREKQQERLGRNKWVAMLVAVVSVFRRYPLLRVVLDLGEQGGPLPRVTPFVFVGNNRYEMNALSPRSRGCLDRGELSLYFTHRAGRFALLRLALRALLGRLDQAQDFEALCLPAFTVETPKKTLKLATDGEVTRLVPPLHFRVRPGALRVIAPPPEVPAEANGGAVRASAL